MNCVIVDDDPIAREVLKKCIERHGELILLKEFESAMVASKELPALRCDLVFLDIEMPEMSGIEFMQENPEVSQVVVVSGKSEYAAEAFDYNVTDYMIKPLDYERFCKAVAKAKDIESNLKPGDQLDHIFVKKSGRLVKLYLVDIVYIEALSDYITIHSKQGKFTVLSTMKAVESKLGQKHFVRIHRSYIIRYDQITEIKENTVDVGITGLPVSRRYKTPLMQRLNTL